MNYLNLYTKIIDNANNQNRTKSKINYFEKHHIIPKSIGGEDSKSNLVLLTAKEHFICHHLLTKIYPNEAKLKFAFWAMCNQTSGDVTREYKITSTVYYLAKSKFSIENSKRHKGKKMPLSHSIASAKRWTENNPHKPGEDSYLYGIPRTQEDKDKISKTKQNSPELNYAYKGDYVTPFGTFKSAGQAFRETGFNQGKIFERCKNNQKVIKKITLKYNDDILPTDLGKTWSDLGWNFTPKL